MPRKGRGRLILIGTTLHVQEGFSWFRMFVFSIEFAGFALNVFSSTTGDDQSRPTAKAAEKSWRNEKMRRTLKNAVLGS